jgi:hypothetical protein
MFITESFIIKQSSLSKEPFKFTVSNIKRSDFGITKFCYKMKTKGMKNEEYLIVAIISSAFIYFDT